MIYKAVIVDDEKHQQELLLKLVEKKFPFIKIIGISSSVDDGAMTIAQSKPDLVFLDVVIPPETGFDLLEKIDRSGLDVIFMSSYDNYAINAFRVSAVDYLLKPFGEEELEAAFEKFVERRKMKQALDHISVLLGNIKSSTSAEMKIALPVLTGYHFLMLGEILYCEADNNYTVFHLKDKKKLLVSRSIRECEVLLREHHFARIHNSYVINLNVVSEYVRGDGGLVKLADGTTLLVSRSRKDEFLEAFDKL